MACKPLSLNWRWVTHRDFHRRAPEADSAELERTTSSACSSGGFHRCRCRTGWSSNCSTQAALGDWTVYRLILIPSPYSPGITYLCRWFVYSSPLLPPDTAPGEPLSIWGPVFLSSSLEHLLAYSHPGCRRRSTSSIPSTASHRYFVLRKASLV